MKRRSRYALTKVSADLPAHIVQQLDGWKTEIEGINRSQLISDSKSLYMYFFKKIKF